ncbi:unnamed protein product [Discula destructiva]
MSKTPIDTFGLTCHSGGDFYICQGNTTEFIGCCASDPCADGSGACPRVAPATFNQLDYQSILPQDCADPAADWYTCSTLSTPFMGCCKSNACASPMGCSGPDLVAAELGNATQAKLFLTSTTTASANTESKTAVSSTSRATTTAAASSSGAAAPVSTDTSSGLSTGAKAGIGVGAVALVALVGVLFFVISRVLRKRNGVVVRGSSPPTSPRTMTFSPTRATHAGPNQIAYAPLANAPVGPSPSSTKGSPSSSDLTGFVSRDASVRSTATGNKTLGTRSGSPAAQRPQYYQLGGSQQLGYGSEPMGVLAELDGSDAFPSPPISEMAGPTPLSTARPSIPFRPYRPER